MCVCVVKATRASASSRLANGTVMIVYPDIPRATRTRLEFTTGNYGYITTCLLIWNSAREQRRTLFILRGWCACRERKRANEISPVLRVFARARKSKFIPIPESGRRQWVSWIGEWSAINCPRIGTRVLFS